MNLMAQFVEWYLFIDEGRILSEILILIFLFSKQDIFRLTLKDPLTLLCILNQYIDILSIRNN